MTFDRCDKVTSDDQFEFLDNHDNRHERRASMIIFLTSTMVIMVVYEQVASISTC